MSRNVDREDTSPSQVSRQWFIDFDWYQSNNRSFLTLAQNCLCPRCRRQLKAKKGEVVAADLLAAVKDCCSREPGFITIDLPILESVFRLFLANGNQLLDLAELSRQLREWRGGDSYRTSVEILSRLLEADQYYGLRPVAG